MARQALTGTRIRDRRLLLGLKQSDLARQVGVSPAYLNLLEHNRRRVGAELLASLARVLKVDGATLAEGSEGVLFDMLREAATITDAGVVPEVDRLEELVGRFPGWAALLAARHSQVTDLSAMVERLSDGMAQDPFLAASLHEVLSAITSVRSTSAILTETEDIEPEWQARFHRNIHDDSVRLSHVAAALVAWLEQSRAPEAGLAAPQEELERWLAARGWFLPELEGRKGASPDSILDAEAAVWSAAGRDLALAYLDQYRADAVALPIHPLRAALARSTDPTILARRLERPLPLVLRRMACLTEADLPGVGLVVCDGTGALGFRRPAPGFPLPRLGAACGLWPLFEALGQPMTPVRRHLSVARGGARAHFVAYGWCERHWPSGFDGPPVAEAQMLILPAAAAEAASAVGGSCRTCAEGACLARREASIIL
ncbi:MAG: helix-turn-helix domain-containing protein [Paracoccaceae bacterium]